MKRGRDEFFGIGTFTLKPERIEQTYNSNYLVTKSNIESCCWIPPGKKSVIFSLSNTTVVRHLRMSPFIKTNTAFARRHASATRLGFGVATRSEAVHLLCTVHRSFVWADTLCYLTFEGAVPHSCCVDNFRVGAVQFNICSNLVFVATNWTTKRSTITTLSKSSEVGKCYSIF